MDNAIKRAINETLIAYDSGQRDVQEIYDKIKKDLTEYNSWAANFGVKVHKSISSLYGGEAYSEPELDELDLILSDNTVMIPTPAMMAEFGDFTKVNSVALATKEWMDANGFECLETEYTVFCRELGIAGTADWIGLHYGRPCCLDFKTQDAEDIRDFHKWPETGLQLADYVTGLIALKTFDNYTVHEVEPLERQDIERISIYTSRTHPGIILPYQWSDESDFKKMEMINEYWFLDKKYDPRTIESVEQVELL